MLDYLALQGSTENPTLVAIVFTVLLSFLLSSLIAFTYEKTTRQVMTPVEYLQSIILVAVVAATVMQAIGDSLARGLGMLGALAIIRFRTTLKGQRNMVFTFASLAAGIACGVYGYIIAIAGTIGFCLFAFVLKYSPLEKKHNLMGTLKFDLAKSSEELHELESILEMFCQRFLQVRYQISKSKIIEPDLLPDSIVSYEYHLKLKKESDGLILNTAISALASVKSVKLNFANEPENV